MTPDALPPEAIKAAREWLHDTECNDGDIKTCGRWKAASDPESRFHRLHIGHVEYYDELATGMLEAAAPHLAAACGLVITARRAEGGGP